MQSVCITTLEDALVDRVLKFSDHLAGETTYSVTVTGYGVATTTDQITVTTGDTPSTQHQVVASTQDLKVLDGEAWPQVHSLYRYNLSTGVLWTTIRTPSFSRIATGSNLPRTTRSFPFKNHYIRVPTWALRSIATSLRLCSGSRSAMRRHLHEWLWRD